MRDFLERRGTRLSFAWGFSEATLFFFLPDIAVGAVALYGLRRGVRAAGAAVAGAVLGGLSLYAVTRWAGPGVRDVLDRLPAIPVSFFAEVDESIAADGGLAIVQGPWRGIPYKLYAAEWALGGHSALALVLWTVPARALRIVGWAVLSWAAAAAWRSRFGRDGDRALLAMYGGVWLAIYTAYFSSVGF